jgi:hypothetical protein
LKVKSKNVLKLSKTQRTDQILSRFKAIKSVVWILYWKYKVCKQSKHNQNNKIYNSKRQTIFDQINIIKDKFNFYNIIKLLSIFEPESESESKFIIQDICSILSNRIKILY